MSGPWTYFNVENDPLILGLDTELMAKLDLARSKAGLPFIITSGKRTADQNAALNGAVTDSAHLTGLAVDIALSGSDHILNRVLYGLYAAGFERMGVYYSLEGTKLVPKHIHADIDITKPSQVTWSLLESN